VIIFGIDPGSERTGYGCVDSDGRRHRLVVFGTIAPPVLSLKHITEPTRPRLIW
jgi:Holliday junction resolvasome RuvABC endonuclease subunit